MKHITKVAWLAVCLGMFTRVALASISVSISPATVHVAAGGQVQFTATVSGTSNAVVIWSLSGTACTGNQCGQITGGGLYTAPAAAPAANVITVTATSLADLTAAGNASVILGSKSDVTVSVSPSQATVLERQQQRFVASVSGTTLTAVTWTLTGGACGASACGTLTPDGLYTAPSSVPSPAQVTIKATSVADPSVSGSAAVTIAAVSVAISPKTVQVLAGGRQQFTATVTDTANTAVSWTVAGTGCSGAACGTISASGVYSAPSTVPNPAQVLVTATSVADSTQSASAQVTVIKPVSVSVSPLSVQVLVGGRQQFTATVTGAANPAVTWTIGGAGCSGAACGTISATGLYTAPAVSPTPNQVSVTATSAADPSKSSTATVTISGPVSVSVSPGTAKVVVGGSQQFSATVSGTSNKSVSWSVTGSGCSGSACGTVSPAGLYFAPATVPVPAQVSVTATSPADSTKSSSASVTILSPIVVTLSPATATVSVGNHVQFTATATGNTNSGILWSVGGSGCSGAACGQISSAGLYTAPGTIPTPAQVTVKAASAADSSLYRTATVTIVPLITVQISPASASLMVGTHQQFAASVAGTTNQSVTWTVTGKGCAGAACGTISPAGLYTAPGSVPSSATVTITATSAVDTTRSGSAIVTILPRVKVVISPTSAQVVIGHQRQFTGTVTGSSNTTVSWALSGSGCSGTGCGTINSAGLYTAPAAIPSSAQVTVKATSAADGTKSASAVLTIIAPVTVTISPASTVLAVNASLQFRAAVNGSTDSAVEWSISGSGCSGSACGSITPAGVYTAPGAVPAPATVIVTASPQIDTSGSASVVVTLVTRENAKLYGPYAFYFTGFDSNGVYQAAGSFTADGNGHITAGREDINRSLGPAANIALTGTYQISSDDRGILTLSTSSGVQTFRFGLNQAATNGTFIAFDTSGIRGTGTFERQDPRAFTVSALKGAYVFSLAGSGSGGSRAGALGLLYLNGSGMIETGSMDVNQGGTLLPTFGSIGGVYTLDGTGRGSLNLSIPGFAGSTFHFALYAISANRLILVSMDPPSANDLIFSGPAQLQAGAPFLVSSLKGATVLSLAGESGKIPQVTAGAISFDGIAQPYAELDQNVGGAVITGKVLTGAYGIDLNGVGTMDLDNSNGSAQVFKIYVIASNHAYIMDASTSAVEMGEIKPRLVPSPFISSDLQGPYRIASGEPLVSNATLYSGESEFDGRDAVDGAEDISTGSTLSVARALKGTYGVASGRALMTETSPGAGTIALWIISPSEAVGAEIDSSNPQPVVLHLEQ